MEEKTSIMEACAPGPFDALSRDPVSATDRAIVPFEERPIVAAARPLSSRIVSRPCEHLSRSLLSNAFDDLDARFEIYVQEPFRVIRKMHYNDVTYKL